MFAESRSRFFTAANRPRLVLLIVFVLTVLFAVVSSATWDPELIRMEWAESPRANSATWCPEGKVCIEWCRVYQGHIEEATGRLCCGTPDMIGTENPFCPE